MKDIITEIEIDGIKYNRQRQFAIKIGNKYLKGFGTRLFQDLRTVIFSDEFRKEFNMEEGGLDKLVCHQVGAAHRKKILESVKIPEEIDFVTFPYLGNVGSASLPISAAIADEQGFLDKNDLVGFFGIGSGLSCMMLGVEW